MSQHALRAANGTFYKAFEQLDLLAMAALWARSVPVSCVHPGWDLVLGHDAGHEQLARHLRRHQRDLLP